MTANWVSVLAIVLGLGSLITQAHAIEESLDPYRDSRNTDFLGVWVARQPVKPWYQLKKPIPVGPVISASLINGFCGRNVVGVSRVPLHRFGKASWTAILAIFHCQELPMVIPGLEPFSPGPSKHAFATRPYDTDFDVEHEVDTANSRCLLRSSGQWTSLSTRPLTRHGSAVCTNISRTTLITLLTLCNARTMFLYSDASGHRAAYVSYCGYWYIEWPLGGAAIISFTPHDSHSLESDVYPPMFYVRVDKCIQMMAGIVVSPDSTEFQCAFPGRKPPGSWILEYQPKGFPGAHGSRHLYNQQGGKVFEVDFLFARRIVEEAPSSDCLKLSLPSTEKNADVLMLVPKAESAILEHALDCLPWSSLSWSIHRGLRDILVAFAKPTMDRLRKNLASQLRLAVKEHSEQLEAQDWSTNFVKNSMADIAASSVLAGGGNSGDSVRVVTDVVMVSQKPKECKRDEIRFWREGRDHIYPDSQLPSDVVIALTKCFVLEWSVDFDYQMYHGLPPELLLR